MARTARFSSVQSRLGLIFLAFLLLQVISITVRTISLEAQKHDARVINVAGRQRMLVQQMTSLALGFDRSREERYVASLRASSALFEDTLAVLMDGGEFVDQAGERSRYTPSANPGLRAELAALQQAWRTYRENIDRLLAAAEPTAEQSAVQAIERMAPVVVAQADRVVEIYEAHSEAKLNQLRMLQFVFLVLSLVLLVAGWWVTGRLIVQPLRQLQSSAERIGQGNLYSAVRVDGPAEMRVLGQTMDKMRQQVLAARDELEQWAVMLEYRVQQRTRELEALGSISQEINANLAIREVLTSVTEKAQGLLGAEVASLCMLEQQGQALRLHAAAGPEDAIQKNYSAIRGTAAEQVLNQKCPCPGGHKACPGSCRIINPRYQASHLAAPLVAGEKVIGALCVGSTTADAFGPEMDFILSKLAGSAAVALENSRLYQQAEHAAALEERHRIASEMHDGLLQTLSFQRLMVRMTREQMLEGDTQKALATLDKIERAEEQAAGEIRRAIASLQDELPINYTLQQQLAELAGELANSAPPVVFQTEVVLPLVLSPQESEQALRVTREALLNARRYSQAETVTVKLETCGDEIAIRVQDRGVGFVPGSEPEDGRQHFGMKIMQARAARLGGKLEIHASPGSGTEILLRWAPGKSSQSPSGG